jgi:iron-sulfur cluster assembly accessory protein
MNNAPPKFSISAGAARRIAEITQATPQTPALRVAVLTGGCSGFQYDFALTDAPTPEDTVIERDGVKVLVDPTSLDFLAGAELDFKDALMGAHFTVTNPNATSACGCGTSFSVD